MTTTERMRRYIKYHNLHIQYRKETASSGIERDKFGYAWWAATFTKAGPEECAETYAFGVTIEQALENLLAKLDAKHAND